VSGNGAVVRPLSDVPSALEMSEPGSSAAAVGIENVEWLDAGGGQLTVRVSGRWRRRRSWVESRGPTALVIEAEGRRHRFPATPEPPSLAGAPPGTWRLSFAVPAGLAPELRGHVWLALGTVTVALPVPESVPSSQTTAGPETQAPPAADAPPADVSAPEPPMADEPAGELSPSDSASLEIERAWRRAEDAQRSASQLGERVSELERALASERSARERQRPLTGRLALERDRLLAEDALRARHRAADVRVPAEPALPPARPSPDPPMRADTSTPPPEPEVIAALRRELAGRVTVEAGLRARTIQAETRLAARVLLERRTAATLAELRDELGLLRDALEQERDRRTRAETEVARLRAQIGGQRERSREAYAAIGELRGALDRLRPPEPAPGGPPVQGSAVPSIGPATAAGGHAVTPDRLSDALARLRQTTEPRESLISEELAPGASPGPAPLPVVVSPAAPARVGGPTIERPFRVLARRDPDRGGRLLLGLLGAQRLAYPHPIVYDLVLGPGHGCVQVTVPTAGEVQVRTSGTPRAPEQVDLQIVGDPARLARLLGSGPLRRLLRLGVARVRGRREGLAALRALLALPLDLGRLPAGAAEPEPEPLLALVAAMIDPAWTAGERFTLSHTDERGRVVYLQVRDGRRPLVSPTAPDGRIATALTGSAGELMRALWTPAEPTAIVEGDHGPLMLVRTWIDRAQAG
jgi:hypothetical protein